MFEQLSLIKSLYFSVLCPDNLTIMMGVEDGQVQSVKLVLNLDTGTAEIHNATEHSLCSHLQIDHHSPSDGINNTQ